VENMWPLCILELKDVFVPIVGRKSEEICILIQKVHNYTVVRNVTS